LRNSEDNFIDFERGDPFLELKSGGKHEKTAKPGTGEALVQMFYLILFPPHCHGPNREIQRYHGM
jgi:hypothetical protein